MPSRKDFADQLDLLTPAEQRRWESINQRMASTRSELRRLSEARRRIMWRIQTRARKAAN